MDTQAITIDEYNNDGSFINLYMNESIGEWCAYGFLAYGLLLFCKANGYNALQDFSEEIQMPVLTSDFRNCHFRIESYWHDIFNNEYQHAFIAVRKNTERNR